MYKINTKKTLAPAKLFIKYKKLKPEDDEIKKDLKIYWSYSNPKPCIAEVNCDGSAINSTYFSIEEPRHFPTDMIYLKFETI